MKLLIKNTKFQPISDTPGSAVDIIKKQHSDKSNIQSEFTPELVNRIYAAEAKRLDWYEETPIDLLGGTIGRGQLSQGAYTDVVTKYAGIWKKYLTQVHLAKILFNAPCFRGFIFNNVYQVTIPTSYGYFDITINPVLEDFVVAGYLAIKILAASKDGRTSKDAARFAVALYHGMSVSVRAAQVAVKDEINWAPVEAELLKQGLKDEVAYVNEVVLK